MAQYRLLLRCIGEAVAHHGARALVGLVPFGERLFDIAREAQARYQRQCATVEAIAQAGAADRSP